MIKLLTWIPAKVLAEKLPDILSYILTKGLGWLFTKYPHKSAKVIEISQEVTTALLNAANAASDGKITKEEVKKQKELWKQVFD